MPSNSGQCFKLSACGYFYYAVLSEDLRTESILKYFYSRNYIWLYISPEIRAKNSYSPNKRILMAI